MTHMNKKLIITTLLCSMLCLDIQASTTPNPTKIPTDEILSPDDNSPWQVPNEGKSYEMRDITTKTPSISHEETYPQNSSVRGTGLQRAVSFDSGTKEKRRQTSNDTNNVKANLSDTFAKAAATDEPDHTSRAECFKLLIAITTEKNNLAREVETLNGQIKELTVKNEKIDQHNSLLRERIGELKDQIENIYKYNSDLRKSINKLSDEKIANQQLVNDSLENNEALEQLQARINTLTTDLATKAQELQDNKARTTRLELENAQDILTHEKDLKDKDKKIDDLIDIDTDKNKQLFYTKSGLIAIAALYITEKCYAYFISSTAATLATLSTTIEQVLQNNPELVDAYLMSGDEQALELLIAQCMDATNHTASYQQIQTMVCTQLRTTDTNCAQL